MNPLIPEFNEKVTELKKIAKELSKDYLEVDSSQESLLIESVVHSLEDAEQKIKQVVFLEEKHSK